MCISSDGLVKKDHTQTYTNIVKLAYILSIINYLQIPNLTKSMGRAEQHVLVPPFSVPRVLNGWEMPVNYTVRARQGLSCQVYTEIRLQHRSYTIIKEE